MCVKKKKNSIKYFILLTLTVLAVSAAVLSAIMILSMRPPEGNKTLNRSGRVRCDVSAVVKDEAVSLESPKEQVYVFLVAGFDKTSCSTDTIMLVRLDVSNKSINIMNIPRDTMLVTDRKSKKINASYSIGGIEQFEKDVASLTGFYVNRYVLFNIEGIEKIIDEIGGVYFDVPKNMHYEDPTQDLYIHINKGYQHLDGKQAVNLARYRNYTDGDIGRIGVQQELLKALAMQALKPENLLKLPELVSLVNDNIETDIEFNEMLWLANEAKEIPVSAIETHIVPGVAATVGGLSYWLPYENEFLELINKYYNPLGSPITKDDTSIVSYHANEGR